jgi:hypothetical protein
MLAKDQIRVIAVPGTHFSMMVAPKINVLGKSLNDAIRQASENGDKYSVPGVSDVGEYASLERNSST